MSSPEALEENIDAHGARAKDKKIAAKKALALRILITLVALAIWFWTQSLLGARSSSSEAIGDGLHRLTARGNSYLQGAPRAANALLIASSALIDALAIFLMASWIFAGKLRPFLGLAMLLVTRQVMQALCSLPAPPGIIWHDPGFPSLLVTYGVASDFFFSGHTAIAVFGAIEIARLYRPWLTLLALGVVLFEIAAVLLLRAHYTMDVFTGALAAVCVAQLLNSSDGFRLRPQC
jgi:hypothetical protein